MENEYKLPPGMNAAWNTSSKYKWEEQNWHIQNTAGHRVLKTAALEAKCLLQVSPHFKE